ncbi:MAG: class I SAM-dependent methyltransferase [Syntrophobacteraceae bacterium]|nr:class I SAM-dependent methyltransferase [Syntrophobacteraceae bacterium]
MIKLLPDRLKESWSSIEGNQGSAEGFQEEQERLLGQYRSLWTEALVLPGHDDLQESILSELGQYTGCSDLKEIHLRCMNALSHVKGEWEAKVDQGSRDSVEQFYNDSQAMLYELMWWHTLSDDTSPLAYVTALEFAKQCHCHSYLDFGSGVGSGSLLFAGHGLEVTLADISTSMLDFSRWRFEQRKLQGRYLDLKQTDLPDGAYDIVTAMDVFEHLVNPTEAVNSLHRAMKPGGYLFGRFHSEVDEDRPQHIVHDFEPTMNCLHSLGFVEIWRDEWLWGHQIFQRQ